MIRAGFTLATFVLHLVTLGRYGYFRDELYFIACGRRLAWGYVDQPPLVAFAAWLSGFFGYNLIALRILPALAAALAVWFAISTARELGGGRFSQILAGICVALVPAYLLLGNTLTTTSFEGLSWTLTLYLIVRIVRRGDVRLWPLAGLALAFGLYGKYSIALLAVAVFIGLLCTAARRVLSTPWFGAAVVLCALLVLPNLTWQEQHGWPMLTVLHGDFLHRHAFQSGLQLESQSIAGNAIEFALEQVLYTNPIAVPIWLIGLFAALFSSSMRAVRFVGIAYLVVFGAAILLEAKGYYIIGIYGCLIAIGCVAIESYLAPVRDTARRGLQVAIPAIVVAATLPFLPLSLPVLPIEGFVRYTTALRLTGQNGQPAHVMQPVYAEEFGWEGLASAVASKYFALPNALRSQTAVFADTYADAAALDFFGPRYGLPPAISGQNTYWLWGTHGYDGRNLLAVGATQSDLLRRLCGHLTLLGTFGDPRKWVVEGPAPIYLCTDLQAPLQTLWPQFKWYGA